MNTLAILLTCFNRKEKTLSALDSIYKAHGVSERDFSMDIFLTDDGSTDDTSIAVSTKFPKVNILKGTGNLFWSEGMRNSWKAAIKEKKYDGYLLFNDDTILYKNAFNQLFKSHQFSTETLKMSGIYVGATENKETKQLTYSGSLITNKFLYTQKRLSPNGEFQKCDLANANIMLVSKEVVDKIGILTEGYEHGIADYDYTLTANKVGIPVLIAPEICGHCINDHNDYYENFTRKSLKERKKILYNPTGLAHRSYKKYMLKFFPMRLPFFVFFGWFKLYFPKLYVNYFLKSRRKV